MSLVHKITVAEQISLAQLNAAIAESDNITFQYRGDATCYYWVPGKSARGMDITFNLLHIEVRNTVLSNADDYRLANRLVEKIMALTACSITDEDDEPVELPLFDERAIEGRQEADCELLAMLLDASTEDIAVNGPVRNVYFGRRVHAAIRDYTPRQLKDKVFGMINKVQWELPAFGYDEVMEIENGDGNPLLMKVLEPGTGCLIDRYDYLLLDREPGRPLLITNEVLNSMLPATWELVDEFTIIAPVLSSDEWAALVERAAPYDMFDSFLKQRQSRHRIPPAERGIKLPQAWRA
ncbi:MAG: hypothetical protein K0R82_949 [Flavipsychrobacter sp.]|nr:hypothetical protein [Flavipsychrobacter sp.]